MIADLFRLIEQLEQDNLLFEADQLYRRLHALDLLDACIPDAAPESAPDPSLASSTAELIQRASALRDRIEDANQGIYTSIRAEIMRGYQPSSLPQWADAAAEIENRSPAGGLGYGLLDELITDVFRFHQPDTRHVPRDPEIVPYQPTPARHIFDLIRSTRLTANDVLIDIGSGLGHVPLLVSICTPARSIGIELEASYVERARQCAAELNLDRIQFLQQDARNADLSTGTVFYLYTPFTGSILRNVLDRLRGEALRRAIRICTYGPITPLVAQESWLEAISTPTTDRIVQFRPKS